MAEEFDIDLDATAVAPALPKLEDERLSFDDTPQRQSFSRKQIIIFASIGGTVLLALLGLIIGLLMFSGRTTDDNRILENVFAAGVDLSGMTVEEAISALHIATDQSIPAEPLIIQIYDDTISLHPDETNASLDIEAIVQAAYDYGRSGSHAENQQIQRNAHKRSYTIPLLPYLNLDLEQIRNTVDSYCADVNSEYSESVVTLVGTRPVYSDPSPEHQEIMITLGTPLRCLDADDLYDQILDTYSMNELLLEYDAPDVLWPPKVTAQNLFDQYCTLAQDAALDTSTYTVTPEVYGYGFPVQDLQTMLDEAMPGDTVEITMNFLEPDVLAEDLNKKLFAEAISECTTSSELDSNARDINLQLACNALDGIIIKPGETFSFLKAIGNISAETGYTEAPICSVNKTTMGGGISQVASTLYHCVLHANLKVVEHHNHTYATDFIELGLDAYVDGSSKDLRFRNNTDSPIRIEAAINRHTVSVTLVGATALSYRISIRSEITSKQVPLTTYQMLIPNNAQGFEEGDVIVKGIEGYKVSVYKEKTDISTGSLLATDSVSINEYKKRDEVIARIGVFIEEEENNEEPTQPETEPTQPETEPTQPETEPTQPETEPTQPETEPTQPEIEPTQPETEPTQPETEPTQPETEPTQPETEPTQPETEPTQPETEPTQQEETAVTP